MRTQRRNKRKMYYALYLGRIQPYKEYTDDDGNTYKIKDGDKRDTYSEPFEFKGNITTSGLGQSEPMEFGLDLSDYNASLVVDKNSIPIDETSLIWQDTEPRFDVDGNVDESSADYTVVKLSKSLNYDRYVLRRVVK